MDQAYTTSTVTGFEGATGLLQTIVTWLTDTPATAGRDWTIERNGEPTDPDLQYPFLGSGYKEYILSNVGLTGVGEVWIGMREWSSGALYGWDCNVYHDYDAGAWWSNLATAGRDSYDGTTEHWDELPMLPLADDSMEYWVYSTQARIVLVVKIGIYYQLLYLGNGRAYGPPSTYPHPAIAAAPAYGNLAYTSSSCRSLFESCASAYNRMVILPDDTYAAYDDTGAAPRDYVSIPSGWILGPTVTDRRPLFTEIQVPLPGDGEVLMDLDGVVLASSDEIATEDDLYARRARWIVFQAQNNPGTFDYCAIAYRDATTTTTSTTSTTVSTSSTTATTATSSSTTSTSSTSSSTVSSSSTSSTTLSTVSTLSSSSSTSSSSSSSSTSSSSTVTPA